MVVWVDRKRLVEFRQAFLEARVSLIAHLRSRLLHFASSISREIWTRGGPLRYGRRGVLSCMVAEFTQDGTP